MDKTRGATEIVGYCDRLDVRPGESVTVFASGETSAIDVSLVRITARGDTSRLSHEFDPVDSVPAQRVTLQRQRCRPGSYGIARDVEVDSAGIVVRLLAQPTLVGIERDQVLMAVKGAAEASVLLRGSTLVARYRSAGDELAEVALSAGVASGQWYSIEATFADRWVRLEATPVRSTVPTDTASSVSATVSGTIDLRGRATVTVASRYSASGADDFFNGKLESPSLLTPECRQLAAWDFTGDQSTSSVTGSPGSLPRLRLVNSPARAVTGASWSGQEVDFRLVPEQYGAIHFHEDDLDDAGWEPTARLDLPADLAPGAYAVLLQSPTESDHIPLFVTAPRNAPRSRVAFLVPTFSYLAYANARLSESTDYAGIGLTDREVVIGHRESQVHRLRQFGGSLYDPHADGSGTFYSSGLRPIFTLRCDWRSAVQDAPRHYAADLIFPSWLESLGVEYDVTTDHVLHSDPNALDGYDVLVTGSHPEYYSATMLDRLATFQERGGSIMYLGANGFYWVTASDPDRPHLIEIRRGHSGIRTWESAPGEVHLSMTGEPGGLWRHRGRAPNQLVGVGMTAQGWDTATPGFVRTSSSYDDAVAFIFDGIDGDVIGDFGLVLGGASGDEIDRADVALGTPRHARVVATSQPHSKYYLIANEELLTPTPAIGGDRNPKVRSDMVYYETPAGGGVFSVGSISWAGSMAYNGFDNNVARLTTNVLHHFLHR